MKKTYIAPALEAVHIQAQQMIALSLQQGVNADSSDALVKDNDWDIFGEYTVEELESDDPFED